MSTKPNFAYLHSMSDHSIRLEAFAFLKEVTALYRNELLPRKLLEEGFLLDNKRITLIGAQGIWKPAGCDFPLSITTTPNSPYDDRTGESLLQYSYRGTNINHPVNVGLREAMKRSIPLIYFFGPLPGKYFAYWPVYIIGDDPSTLTFTVALDGIETITPGYDAADPEADYRRKYLTTSMKMRIHQRAFRERVLYAYSCKCAFCRLKHSELLDAAHIIADTEQLGDPIVINGLSLCKIHHAAFDNNILGVTPDYIIKVREDILHEIDGPMLKFGLQSFNDQKLFLPTHQIDYPDKERLEIRYDQFKSAI